MALVVNTNVASIQAQYNVSKTNQSMQDSMAALSSGKRINNAGDDAAGLTISTRMEAQVRGLSQAIRNANDGISLVNTAEGAMDEISNMLQRMRELSVQASNDTLNDQDRININEEFSQLKSEIDRVVENTRFNDMVLLDGSFSGKSLAIGAKDGEDLALAISSLSTSLLGTTATSTTSAASVTATASGSAAVENVVNLTFNGNDQFSFTITLDGATQALDGTNTTTIDQEISVSASVTNGDAAAIAKAINDAVETNDTDQGGGKDLEGILTARAVGNTVVLTNKAGSKIDFSNFASSGTGTMTVNPITNSDAASKVLENTTELTGLSNNGGTEAVSSTGSMQFLEGKAYKFFVNNTLIEFDTTTAGLAKATNGNLAGARADLDTAITNAINATSGAGKATVTVAASGAANSTTVDMVDATGKEIVVSGFQKVTSAQVPDGFLTVNVDVSADAVEIIENDEFMTADQATGTPLEVAAGKTARIQFSNQDLSYTFFVDNAAGTEVSYTVDGITKDFNEEVTRVAAAITAAGGLDVTATNKGGVLEIVNNTASAITFGDGATAISSDGLAAVSEGTAFFLADALPDTDISDEATVVSLVDGSIVRTSDGVEASASQMSLSFSTDDRYTFKLDHNDDGTGDVTITADVVNGSLTALSNVVNSHFSTTGISASVENGSLVLTKADGTDFRITDFESEGVGEVFAANAAGQGGSAVLQNSGDGASMTIAASGAAAETVAELSFAEVHADGEKISFKISDGNSIATVRATTVDPDGGTSSTLVDRNEETALLLAEINSALSAANMSNVTAAATNGVITLKNVLGGELSILDYKSDSTAQMTFAPKTGQGTGVILNDDADAASQASVAAMDTLTAASAGSAIEALDRALENVNGQRSKLGAAANRLEYTVANLGNVVTNTEASRSRIEDADFAAESAKLAKNQILLQAGTAMLAQANASQQTVLSLLG
jgi:flagellin